MEKLYNRNAERAILAECILNNPSISFIRARIHNRDYFYADEHKLLFDIITELDDAQITAFDRNTIDQRIHEKDLSTKLTNKRVDKILLSKSSNDEVLLLNIKTVFDLYIKRITADSLALAVKRITEDGATPSEAIAELQKAALLEQNVTGAKKIASVDIDFSKQETLPSLFDNSDSYVIRNGTMSLIAARPGMGKTTYALQLAWDAAKHFNKPIYFISIEMTEDQVLEKVCGINYNVDMEKLSTEQRKEYILRFKEENSDVPFLIEDSLVDINDIIMSIRNEHVRNGFEAVFIDYIQLINVPKVNPTDEYARVTASSFLLRQMVRSLKTRLVCLAQLNRDLERRDDKRPIMADLRSSGQIEQDAALILFLYRSNYYGIKEYDKDDTSRLLINETEVIVGKNRFGKSRFSTRLHFGTGVINNDSVVENKNAFIFRNTSDVVKVSGNMKIEKDNTIDTNALGWG